ncbi:MAG: FAD-dependent oxidoreductase [Candidatus Heimdallarchaeota archaeon]|nr:FAD-dependent oxidoreductase [Candidatus Heimdallarchaeota archaeon]
MEFVNFKHHPMRSVFRKENRKPENVFNDWLADNLDMLSKIFTVNFHIVEREARAEGLRTDILAKFDAIVDDQLIESTAVIECQQKKSDSKHFGQLITYGRFIWSEELSEKVFCIGAGSGITPFRAFLQYFADNKLQHHITLLYSNSYGNNIIAKDEIDELVLGIPNCRYKLTITREIYGLQQIRRGRINEPYLQELLQGWTDSLFYLCGSRNFTDAMYYMLQKLGISKDQIYKEKWG